MRTVEEIFADLNHYFPMSQIHQGEDGMSLLIEYDFVQYRIIFSWGMSWEHASISKPGRHECPTWNDMCCFKNLFWREDETVIQYHPAKSKYVNVHPYVLHLWRPIGKDIPTPPMYLV